MSKSNDKIVIGDLHFPFGHKEKIKQALEYISYKKPKHVVQIGDLYDMFSASKFPKFMLMTPMEEMHQGRQMAEEFWSAVQRLSPHSKCWQLYGNHDDRPYKRFLEKAPELLIHAQMEKHWMFKDVETIHDSTEVPNIDGTLFTHGIFGKIGDHLKQLEFKNVAHGHTHTGGVYYHRLNTGAVRWELDCGYLANPFHPSLSYRTFRKYFKWTPGIGEIDEFGPRFIAFGVNDET